MQNVCVRGDFIQTLERGEDGFEPTFEENNACSAVEKLIDDERRVILRETLNTLTRLVWVESSVNI